MSIDVLWLMLYIHTCTFVKICWAIYLLTNDVLLYMSLNVAHHVLCMYN